MGNKFNGKMMAPTSFKIECLFWKAFSAISFIYSS